MRRLFGLCHRAVCGVARGTKGRGHLTGSAPPSPLARLTAGRFLSPNVCARYSLSIWSPDFDNVTVCVVAFRAKGPFIAMRKSVLIYLKCHIV